MEKMHEYENAVESIAAMATYFIGPASVLIDVVASSGGVELFISNISGLIAPYSESFISKLTSPLLLCVLF